MLAPAITRRGFLALTVAAPLCAADPWEESRFPDWSPRTIERLLTDSPWARPVTVAYEWQPASQRLQSELAQIRFPGGLGRQPQAGSSGVRTEVYLTIRWSSALPIRQALALERWTREGLREPEAVEYLGRKESSYVIEMFGVPVLAVPQGHRWLQAELAQSARLLVKGHEPARAALVSVPAYGEHLAAEIRFPRDPITAADSAAEFAAEAGAMKIRARFKLKSMFYGGQLEL